MRVVVPAKRRQTDSEMCNDEVSKCLSYDAQRYSCAAPGCGKFGKMLAGLSSGLAARRSHRPRGSWQDAMRQEHVPSCAGESHSHQLLANRSKRV